MPPRRARSPAASTSALTTPSQQHLAAEDADDDGGAADTSVVVEGLPCLAEGNFVSSYSWHSTGDYQANGRKEQQEEEEPWIIGIDEAGRGPVLGPQVYGIAYCPARYSDGLKSMGFADSKALSEKQRAYLMQEILDNNAIEGNLHYGVTLMHPRDISAGMLQRSNYSLNAQSQDVTVKLIQSVLGKGYPVQHVFVDPVGPHELYAAKLQALFPSLQFTVVPKADALFPIVSAASIVAKVTRDTTMEVWQFSEAEAILKSGRDWGSGYPSDPRTVSWLESHLDPLFGYPSIARQSWGTIRQLMDKKGYRIKWCEEESANSIRKYFSTAAANGQGREDVGRPALFKDLSMTSVGSL